MARDRHFEVVVGIGCSAGGVEALKSIVGKLPADNCCYIIMQHLSPNHSSHMPDILKNLTDIEIVQAETGMSLSSNRIFLPPPGTKLEVEDSKIKLTKYGEFEDRTPLHSIDIFLESLAKDQCEKAVAVILSGSGTDGVRGCRAIKEEGGFVMAQAPHDAKFASMPAAIIKNELADIVTTLDEFPEEILELIEVSKNSKKAILEVSEKDYSFEEIIKQISESCSIDFTRYKKGTLKRRIAKRVALSRLGSIEDYLARLKTDPIESRNLANDFFIGVTSFFRDPEFFEALVEKAIKKLVKMDISDKKLRVWVPACSSGEEAYSIAILLTEAIKKEKSSLDFRIFGSDIDERAIAKAQDATYPNSALSDVPEGYRAGYFEEISGGSFRIKKSIRDKVVFSKHDLLSDPPFGRMHLISFRNCAIYFDKEAQKETVMILEHSLLRDGYLFLGSSESAPTSPGIETIDQKAKIFKKVSNLTSSRMFDVIQTRSVRTKTTQQNGDSKRPMAISSSSIEHAIIEEISTPTFAININGDLLHIAGDVNHYTTLRAGSVSKTIYEVLKPELKTAVLLLMKRFQKISNSQITVDENAHKAQSNISLNGQLLRVSALKKVMKASGEIFLIQIAPVEENKDRPTNTESSGDVVEGLLEELDQSRKDLNFTVENLESSNEELQSSNEELVTTNEELQSVNEELQSVNEELYTMNSEYQNKIDEISEGRKDLDTILEIAHIGTLFLDSTMVIRKVSKRMMEIAKLREGDVGRQISDFSKPIYADFFNDCKEVIEKREPIEKQIKINTDLWSLVKIHPYESYEGIKDGVVVMVIDISELKAVRESQDLLFKFLLSEDQITYGVDPEGRIDYWPDSSVRFFKIDRDKALGVHESILIPLKAQNDIGLVRKQIDNGLPAYISETYRLDNNDEELQVTLIANGRYNNAGRLSGIRYTLFKPREEKKDEDRIKRELETLRALIENNPMPMIVFDKEGSIEFANDFAIKSLKMDKDEIYQRSFDNPKWEVKDLEGELLKREDLVTYKVINNKENVSNQKITVKTGDGKTVSICVSGSPVWNDGQFNGAIISFYVL